MLDRAGTHSYMSLFAISDKLPGDCHQNSTKSNNLIELLTPTICTVDFSSTAFPFPLTDV